MISKKLIGSVLLAVCIPSCSSLKSKSVVHVDAAVIEVSFRNDSAGQVNWTVEDENTGEAVFRNTMFGPKEVKRASITTSETQRYGAVRFRSSDADGWGQDSLIESGQTIELVKLNQP